MGGCQSAIFRLRARPLGELGEIPSGGIARRPLPLVARQPAYRVVRRARPSCSARSPDGRRVPSRHSSLALVRLTRALLPCHRDKDQPSTLASASRQIVVPSDVASEAVAPLICRKVTDPAARRDRAADLLNLFSSAPC